jgi:hypothetical protein
MNGSLSCSAESCVHNVGGLCNANTIHVGGSSAVNSSETQCRTYAEKGLVNAITKVGNMNIAGEIKQLFDSDEIEMYPAIKCDAINCFYNKNRVCNADKVQISGVHASNSKETDCETFIENRY